MLDPDVIAFVRAALPAPGARVLEVGAGDGELADALRHDGHDVLAIDPASRSPSVRAVALHELVEPAGSFDAAVAVVSLHHVEPLEPSCRRLGELVRPGGALVIDEFDVERFDERAARWCLDHGAGDDHGHAGDPAGMAAKLRDHLHSLGCVYEALGAWFALEAPVRGPYLHRWRAEPGLLEAEERLIAAGGLPVVGARLVGTRR